MSTINLPCLMYCIIQSGVLWPTSKASISLVVEFLLLSSNKLICVICHDLVADEGPGFAEHLFSFYCVRSSAFVVAI